MPSGLGHFDARGIWQYGELDNAGLASDLLNLGQESTSDQIAADRTRLTSAEARLTAVETRARVLLTMAKSTPTGSTVVLGGTSPDYTFTEVDDSEGWHNPASNQTRVKPNITGRYLINLSILWAVNGTGFRLSKLKKNGTDVTGNVILAASPGSVGEGSLSTIVDLNGTSDYIEVSSFQNSGSALLTTVSLDVMYLGKIS